MDAQNDLLKALKTAGVKVTASSTYDVAAGTASATYSLTLNGEAANKYDVITTSAAGGTFEIRSKSGEKLLSITASGYNKTATANGDVSDTISFNATKVTAGVSTAAQAAYYDRDGNKISANDLDNYFATYYTSSADATGTTSARADAPKVYDAVGNETTLKAAEIAAVRDKVGTLAVNLHVGADATSNNQITMNIETMSAKGLGVNGLQLDGVDDSRALGAIEKIKAAITKVSAQRSDLGAVQNRLEHTINNLDNVVENTTSAESQIRDTDMASEMVKYSNNNILSQAGQAMLAQANQSNQGVLSLLG